MHTHLKIDSYVPFASTPHSGEMQNFCWLQKNLTKHFLNAVAASM